MKLRPSTLHWVFVLLLATEGILTMWQGRQLEKLSDRLVHLEDSASALADAVGAQRQNNEEQVIALRKMQLAVASQLAPLGDLRPHMPSKASGFEAEFLRLLDDEFKRSIGRSKEFDARTKRKMEELEELIPRRERP